MYRSVLNFSRGHISVVSTPIVARNDSILSILKDLHTSAPLSFTLFRWDFLGVFSRLFPAGIPTSAPLHAQNCQKSGKCFDICIRILIKMYKKSINLISILLIASFSIDTASATTTLKVKHINDVDWTPESDLDYQDKEFNLTASSLMLSGFSSQM